MEYKVIEKSNPLAVHCLTWSFKRAQEWVDRYGDSGIFMNRALTRESFEIVKIDSKRYD